MTVLVDTCVWSLALRRREGEPHAAVAALRDLVAVGRAGLIGPIRQELLSGIRRREQYETLRQSLRAFDDLEVETEDYERAAAFFNLCRGRGLQGSNTDFLICALASRMGLPVFTTDKDFERFAEHLPIRLFVG